ncbi:MAG: NAD(P)H-dependent oxidoreductase [Planctomycetes bacterium]|nr:NAD(P)H-dependent oxidoreductase [Planctomycetota bacterium]
MEPVTTPERLLQILRWRYATKRFDKDRRIPAPVWEALEQALVLAPSSFGLQPWKFLVVDDPALRQELRRQSWNQSQVTDADRYVVFTALRTTTEHDVERFLQRTTAVRGTPPGQLAGYGKVIVDFLQKGWAAKDLFGWNARQAYLALGQFMTAAALLGVDTCPMEGIDANGYDRALGLHGSRYATLCACAVGYRAGDDKYAAAPKVRYPADEVIERR